jgi:predicted aspartyl protease
LPVTIPAQTNTSSISGQVVRFKVLDGYLMIVQATVNGVGPFNFLLDTGTTRTVIDPALAQQLSAPVLGEVAVTGALHQRQDKLVMLKELQLDEASVSGLGAVVDKIARQKLLAPGIRGVLGEDFLSRFDILIDFRQHWLRFGDAPPAGERHRFETTGQYHGAPTNNRLLIRVEVPEIGNKQMQLQLDSGARMVELFTSNENSPSSQPLASFMATSSGANSAVILSNTSIKIGAATVRGLDVVQSRRVLAFDAAGLLPASIFDRIYISHAGGFIILNPRE